MYPCITENLLKAKVAFQIRKVRMMKSSVTVVKMSNPTGKR